MATGIECVCCQEITRVTDMIGELEIEQELKCISEHPGFEPVCLNTCLTNCLLPVQTAVWLGSGRFK